MLVINKNRFIYKKTFYKKKSFLFIYYKNFCGNRENFDKIYIVLKLRNINSNIYFIFQIINIT